MTEIHFYFRLLLRRLPYLIFFVLLGSAIGVTVALILPPSYVARAQLVVERQQISDDLASSTVQTETAEQLQIIQQRILTRSILIDLADEFDLYDMSDGNGMSPDEIISDMRSRISITTSGAEQRRGRAIQATLIDVSFEASKADTAASVANEVVTLILQENIEMRTAATGQTLEFFEREVDRLDEMLIEAGNRISIFQRDNSDALPESLDFRREQLLASQERVAAIEREIAQLRESKRTTEALFEQTGGLMAPDEALTPEARELQNLRDRYTLDSAVMSDQNPRLVMMRQQIDALESIVAGQTGTEIGTGDQARTLFELRLDEIDAQIADLEQQRDDFETRLAELARSIEETPGNAVAMARFERDLQNIQRQYDAAVARRAQAETGDTIEALSKGQRISIIENAEAPDQPSSPDRPRVAMLGFAGGLAAGLGLIALLELMNSSVRRGVEIERALDITPIATLSYMRTHAEVRRRRALVAGVLVLIGVGVPAGLWATHTYVRPLDMIAQGAIERMPEIPVLSDALRGVF
jgi:uncharacterized protein involved in exopolysaccharide biosynthesis